MDSFLEKHELRIILLLCVLAAVRVFIYCAAFPPFNDVDEPQHFDLVCRYAEGIVPDHLTHYGKTASRILAMYSTLEYLRSPQSLPGGRIPPPLWSMHNDFSKKISSGFYGKWRSMPNSEATQPPVYYAVAAVWARFGMLVGVRGGFLLYWVRFMNVWVYALLVWSAYAFLRRLYPANLMLKIGVPLILAFLPQDALYSVTNDILTPLLFCVSFFCLLELHKNGPGSYRWCVLTGLCVAATFLTKYSNLAILVLLGITLVLAALKLRREGRLREGLPKLAALKLACVLPIAAWLARNYLVLHDITGSMAKTHALGWTPNTLAEMSDHPIFLPGGAFTFLRDLTLTFWRGEIKWHAAPLASSSADTFYWLSTFVFIAVALWAMWFRRRKGDAEERFGEWMSFLVLAASIAILVWISVAFDFGRCAYPSRQYPFCTSGRLIFGCIAPFLMLYIKGLDCVLRRLKLSLCWFEILLCFAALMTVSEVMISMGVFRSAYNLFHML